MTWRFPFKMVFRQPENGLQGRDYTVSGCLGRGVCGSLKPLCTA
ncbi:hypothetical protein [Kingella oralis]|nr:hypothetical protein [Kingella oralis]